MERAVQEVLASQKKMLKRRDEKPSVSDTELESQFQEHLRAVKYWLARKPGFRVLYVNYNEMMKNPGKLCLSVKSFLDQPLDLEAMQAVPNQTLYRNRS
jgi:hypothetical protein